VRNAIRRMMEQLARLRELKGFSQRALAKESGVSPATIYELENGRRKPNPSTLRKLAGALDVEVSDLLGVEYPKEGRRSSLEPMLFNGFEEERRGIELELAGLFRNLARRARFIAERSRQDGPSAELSQDVMMLHSDAAHLYRIRGPRAGESEELAEAQEAYQEAENVIQAMLRQDLDATDEERREARRFRSGAEETPGSREADAS
jgi:transcriptional regulator with XRE-family HTH domain